jgi:hypothetical protein
MTPKNLFVFLNVLFIAFCSRAETGGLFIDTTSALGYGYKTINIGYSESNQPTTDESSSVFPDTLIRIDTITENQFRQFAQNYSSQINTDTSFIASTDSSFTLRGKDFSRTFDAYRICECIASTYLGLLSPLNLFIIKTTDMQNETSSSFLIDRKTGKTYVVPGCSDPGMVAVLISPKQKYLLTYDNSYYEYDNCCIYILDVKAGSKKNNYVLESYMNINLDRLNITQLVWLTDASFALSVTDQIDPANHEESGKEKYFLRVTLPKEDDVRRNN